MATRMGRPPEFKRRVRLEVLLEARERREITRAAKQARVSASAWMRTTALAALHESNGGTD
jgi:uncharacterized membrane protein